MIMSSFLQRLGIEHPILLAPMAGAGGTPELAAAVSNAGGLGAWGGAYVKPEEIAATVRRMRALTPHPFNINLFAGGYETERKVDPGPMLEIVGEAHAKLGLPPPVLPGMPASPFDAQLEAVLEERPPVFSFTFGVALARADRGAPAARHHCYRHGDDRRGGAPAGACRRRRDRRAGRRSGRASRHLCRAVRGFDGPDGQARARDLRRRRAAGDSVRRHHGRSRRGGGVALGAAAVQLGTAFLPCPESGAPAAYKRALLDAKKDTTVITRAFSGRPARGLTNGFIAMVAGKESAILPFRQQNDLTRPMRNAAGRQGVADFISLWAGQGVARSRAMPAADLVATLIAESRRSEAARP